MRPALLDELAAALDARREAGLLRRLELPRGHDFSSNDYLGLSRVPAPARAPDGAARPASRLLGGDSASLRRLEARVAAWKGHEAALLFPSGYQANVSLLPALIGRRDRALSDARNHASVIDGLRLARPAVKAVYRHLDVDALGRALAEPHPEGRTFVITEALYSMDGDLAPLTDYAALCARYGAHLVVDEAHASGLYGARGSGWVEALGLERAVTAVITTFGKSLAASGAAVSGPRVLVDYLAQVARGFVYTTAPADPLVALIDGRLEQLAAAPDRGARAVALAERLRTRLCRAATDAVVLGAHSPIVPVVLGSPARAVAAAEALSAGGFDVRAVRPPTVPEGTSRLRISVHADHGEALVDALGARLLEVLG